MIVELDRSSDEPPHAQLTRQLIRLIADGTLEVGAQLPTVRQLAGDLGVAPNTVARCFKELETAGLLATDGRRGTTVAGTRAAAQRERRNALTKAARAFVEIARDAGASNDETLSALRAVLAK